MAFELLANIAASLGFIALISICAWAMSRKRVSRIGIDEALVREVLAQDHPDYQLSKIAVGTDEKAALLEVHPGGFGIVSLLGDKWTIKLFSRGDLGKVSVDAVAKLSLRFNDYTFPAATVQLANVETAMRWQRDLTGEATR